MEKKEMYEQRIIILTAPSGAGKTTIAHELIRQLPQLTFSISVTTRPSRTGETEGKDYYFISIKEFKKKIADDAFVEYEKVYEDKYYGTLKTELERIWQEHKYPLRIVDVTGADHLKNLFGDHALSIFIKPPSFDILKQRIINRGRDDEAGIKERLSRAFREMKYEDRFDHVVLNDDLQTAINETISLVKTFIDTK